MLGVIRAKHLTEFTPSFFDRTIHALKQDGDLRNTALEVLTRLANIKPVQVRTKQNKELLHFRVNPYLAV